MIKKIIRAIIVDDERLARKELTLLLSKFSEIEIIGEAGDVSSAKKLISNLNPDVIFLDIQMPGESGFDLVNEIPSEAQIIFVTAFDEYAIRAFEINALDYLLKPVNPLRLKDAITRLMSAKNISEGKLRKLKPEDRLLIVVNKKLQFIKVETIIYIASDGDYTEIKVNNNVKGITHKPIKEWEFRLPESMFVRIHRSTIINLEYINKFEEWFQNSYRVYLKNIEKPFEVSRRYAAKLKAKFS
jgi:two-component system, LytTR family, response regulator